MTDAHEGSESPAAAAKWRETPRTESLGDLLRYFFERRVQLLVWFALLVAFGGLGFGAWWVAGPRSARGVIALGFRGIEKHAYPNGRKFSIEELRSPEVLKNAVERAGIAGEGVPDMVTLQGGVDVLPIVPARVLQQWQKHDREGTPREDFLPSDFLLDVHPRGLDEAQRVRLLYALVDAYREQAKAEQLGAAYRIASLSRVPMHELVAVYGLWDVPGILSAYARNLREHVEMLIEESRAEREPRFHFRFREIGEALQTWENTRLESLTASVYRAVPVADADLMGKRLQERIATLDTDLRRVRDEASETAQLLQIVDRPKSMLAADVANKGDTPLVDVTALEKLLRADYVGPVVQRVAKLNEEAAKLMARKLRAERELALFRHETTRPDPDAAQRLVPLADDVAKDLTRIADEYTRALEDYLDATITGLVSLREGAYLRRPGPRPALLVLGLLACAAVGAVLIVLVRDTLWLR